MAIPAFYGPNENLCLACKRSRVRISSSPLEENASGIEPVAFFDGLIELVILGLTRSDPLTDLLGQELSLQYSTLFKRRIARSL